jgi:hypothetical protein
MLDDGLKNALRIIESGAAALEGRAASCTATTMAPKVLMQGNFELLGDAVVEELA